MSDHALIATAARGMGRAFRRLGAIYHLVVPPALRRLIRDERKQIVVASSDRAASARSVDVAISSMADLSTPHGVRTARRGASRWPTLLAISPDALLVKTIDLPAQASGDPDGVTRLNLRRWTSFTPDEAFFRVDRASEGTGGACRIHVTLVPRSAILEDLTRSERAGVPLDGLHLPDGRWIALTGRKQRLRRRLRILDVILAVIACGLMAFVVRHERAVAEQAWSEALQRSRSAQAAAREADTLSRDLSDLRQAYHAAVRAVAGRNAVVDAVDAIAAIVPARARVDALVVGDYDFELRMTIDAGEVPGTPGSAVAGEIEISTVAELADGRRSLWVTGRLIEPRK